MTLIDAMDRYNEVKKVTRLLRRLDCKLGLVDSSFSPVFGKMAKETDEVRKYLEKAEVRLEG